MHNVNKMELPRVCRDARISKSCWQFVTASQILKIHATFSGESTRFCSRNISLENRFYALQKMQFWIDTASCASFISKSALGKENSQRTIGAGAVLGQCWPMLAGTESASKVYWIKTTNYRSTCITFIEFTASRSHTHTFVHQYYHNLCNKNARENCQYTSLKTNKYTYSHTRSTALVKSVLFRIWEVCPASSRGVL